jgi:hypothetical protein
MAKASPLEEGDLKVEGHLSVQMASGGFMADVRRAWKGGPSASQQR